MDGTDCWMLRRRIKRAHGNFYFCKTVGKNEDGIYPHLHVMFVPNVPICKDWIIMTWCRLTGGNPEAQKVADGFTRDEVERKIDYNIIKNLDYSEGP